jgi:hypothetical protein
LYRYIIYNINIYEVWLLNNETGYEKRFYYKKLFYIRMLPFNILPLLATHLFIRFFNWSKQCWKSSLVRAYRSSVIFCFTASIDSNRVPFKADFIFGNKKKSHGAKSDEYGVCPSTGVRPNTASQIARYRQVRCPGAKSTSCSSTTRAVSYELVLAVLTKLTNSRLV